MMESDGAAALVLVSGEKALQLGLHIIAKIKGYADAAQVLKRTFFFPHEKKNLFISLFMKLRYL